jgi:hypothetical protein
MRPILRFAIPILITMSGYAENPSPLKPVCNAQTRGKLWPENTARHAATAPIELCSMRRWRYRWEQLTIDVTQLRSKVAIVKAPASSVEAGVNKAAGSNPEASE